MALYSHAEKRRIADWRIMASLHGVKVDDRLKSLGQKENNMLFKSPDEYADMSQEKKENLTQQMMAKHKKMFG